MVIELGDDEDENHNKVAYVAFEEAIEAKDHKAYIEAL